ncbi:MAG TPA: phosphomannose isomerase type II C-terminal cupin domain [Candidatus Paceibacterota bacterium]|jgi:mannose-6-phosphate isomerase-like protein (cupin superfamily)|nr:phosphomannose isomerase type II C-terminal cupin domain [Candidatus Paceibacterota bacterium]
MSLLSNRYHEDRPWGSFDRFTSNEVSTVKFLHVAAGQRFSLQKHAKRSEFWKTIEGSGVASIDGADHPMNRGDEVEIPVGSTHRLTGGPDGITVLEIALGEFDENDIERLEDDYGRAAESHE